jgi:hypothetical protein
MAWLWGTNLVAFLSACLLFSHPDDISPFALSDSCCNGMENWEKGCLPPSDAPGLRAQGQLLPKAMIAASSSRVLMLMVLLRGE